MEKEKKFREVARLDDKKFIKYTKELLFYFWVLNKNVNEVDFKIVYWVNKEKISLGDLSKKIEIAPVNTWKHITKLKQMGVIEVPETKKGKRKYPYINNFEHPAIKHLIKLSKIYMQFIDKKANLKDHLEEIEKDIKENEPSN